MQTVDNKRGGRTALALAVSLGAFLFGPSALAQDSIAQGLRIWKEKGQCAFCHGWAGDGMGDAHSEGKAPALRETALTRDQIYETIKCGRPGTAMPHFDKFAYTDKRCYGLTAAELGKDVPNDPPAGLQIYEVEAIADYVAQKLKGAGKVTFEECSAYFGGTPEECTRYPKKGTAALETPARATIAAAQTLAPRSR